MVFPHGEVRKTATVAWVALALVAGGVGVAPPALAAPAISRMAALPNKVVAAARSQLGVREIPENRGRRVREIRSR